MKILSLIIDSKDKLNEFQSLKINHGHLRCFPWLVAHNFLFFGEFNFGILEMLLKHKRGFNASIGSKRRKFYFSDVKSILGSSYIRLHYVEDFKQTDFYCQSLIYKDCEECCCSNIGVDNLSCFDTGEVRNDVSELDYPKPPPPSKRFNIEDLEVKKIPKTLVEEVIENICELSFNLDEINEQLAELNSTMDKNRSSNIRWKRQINMPFNRIVKTDNTNIILDYFQGLVREKTTSSAFAYENFLKAIMKFEASPTQSNNSSVISSKNFFMDKKHFYFYEELISIILADDIATLKRKDKENPGRFASTIKTKEGLLKGCREFLSDTKRISRITRSGKFEGLYDRSKPNLLLSDVLGVEGNTVYTEEDYTLFNKNIKVLKAKHGLDVRVESGVVDEMNLLTEELESYLDSKEFNKVADVRKKIISYKSERNLPVKYSDLCFSEVENDKVENLVDLLIKKEMEYLINCRRLAEGYGVDDCEDNRIRFEARMGISKHLSHDDWNKQMFELFAKPDYIRIKQKYEFLMGEFEKIVGITPLGVVCSNTRDIDYTKTLTKIELDLLESRFDRNPERSYNQEEVKFEEMKTTLLKSYLTKSDLSIVANFAISITEADIIRIDEPRHSRKSYKEIVLDPLASEIVSNDKKLEIYNEARERVKVLEDEQSTINLKMEILSDKVEDTLTYINNMKNKKTSKQEIVKKEGVFIKSNSNKIERELKLRKFTRKIQKEYVDIRIQEAHLKLNNRFSCLEVDEVLEQSEIAAEVYLYKPTLPKIIKDFKKYDEIELNRADFIYKREMESKNLQINFDSVASHNEYAMIYKSATYKKYQMTNIWDFLRLMAAFAIMGFNPTLEDYLIFGLKKCQAKYALARLRKSIKEDYLNK